MVFGVELTLQERKRMIERHLKGLRLQLDGADIARKKRIRSKIAATTKRLNRLLQQIQSSTVNVAKNPTLPQPVNKPIAKNPSKNPAPKNVNVVNQNNNNNNRPKVPPKKHFSVEIEGGNEMVKAQSFGTEKVVEDKENESNFEEFNTFPANEVISEPEVAPATFAPTPETTTKTTTTTKNNTTLDTQKSSGISPLTIGMGALVVAAIVGVVGLVVVKRMQSKKQRDTWNVENNNHEKFTATSIGMPVMGKNPSLGSFEGGTLMKMDEMINELSHPLH